MKCGECQYAERVCPGAYRCKPAYLDKLNAVLTTKPWLSTSEAAEHVEGDPRLYHNECDRVLPSIKTAEEAEETAPCDCNGEPIRVGDKFICWWPGSSRHARAVTITRLDPVANVFIEVEWGFSPLQRTWAREDRFCSGSAEMQHFCRPAEWEKLEAERQKAEKSEE